MDSILTLSSQHLYNDFTTNHYPEVDEDITIIKGLTVKINSIGNSMHRCIKIQLERYLDKQNTRYREDDRVDRNSIPIGRFMDRLWRLIETNSHDDSEFTIDRGDPETPRIIFSNIGHGIMYECLPNQDSDEILKQLCDICRTILSNITNELNDFNNLKDQRRVMIKTLLERLDRIQYSYTLYFINIDIRCRYIAF
jgi:hypothetical protein